MEKTDLSAAEYWETPGVDVRLNPRLGLSPEGLGEFVSKELGLESAVVFATSGSTGSGPKFVVLTRDAILASADAVNRHLSVTEDDRWLGALTTFHVGGLGVWARAFRAGCFATGIDGEQWDKTGRIFSEACRNEHITLTALTPTHLHDIVAGGHHCPDSVRAILVGGAPLDGGLLQKAVRLGWPVVRTYGMTESASQIATENPGNAREEKRSEFIDVLPVWDATADDDGELGIKGDPLFHAYVSRDGSSGNWRADFPFAKDGWFMTGDRVEIAEGALRWIGRTDDRIKKLGEMISLTRLRENLRKCFGRIPATILSRPHDRLGNELIGVAETDDPETIRESIAAFQDSVAPFERIDRFFVIGEMPRTSIGKVAHGRLSESVTRGGLREISLSLPKP